MPAITFTTKGHAEVLRAQEQINTAAGKLDDIYKKDTREAKNLERAAKRIYESLRTPQEQMFQKIKQIGEAQKKGLIPPKEAETAITRLKTKMGDLETATGKTFGQSAITKMLAFAGGVGGIGTAVALVTNEFRSQLELIDRAAATQLSLVPSRQNLIGNLGALPVAEKASILSKAQLIALRTGVPEAFINEAIGTAASASGVDVPRSIKAVEFAARKFADRPAQIAEFAGSLLDLGGVVGSNDPRVAAGALNVLGSQSRIVKPRQLALNAPKALIAAQGFGAELAGGVALFSTLGGAIKDPLGEVTKTAVINFGKALDLFDERLAQSGRPRAAARFAAEPNLTAKITALQQSPELREQFLSKPIGVPGEAIVPVRQLLDPNSAIAKQFAANRAAVPGQKELIKLAEKDITDLRIDPLFAQAQVNRQLNSLVEDFRKRSPIRLGQEARENLKEILQLTGRSNLTARGKLLLGQLSGEGLGISIPETADILSGQAERLRTVRKKLVGAGLTASRAEFNTGQIIDVPPTGEELLQAGLLEDIVKLMRESVDQQRESVKQQQETNRKLSEGGLVVGSG